MVCACPPGDVDIEGNVCMGTAVRQGGVLGTGTGRCARGGMDVDASMVLSLLK